jgi:drug/metabolite transporter (DMT)-like permease
MISDFQEPNRRAYAVGLMVSSSVVISFTGLIVRLLDIEPMVMNFYRALSMMIAIVLILAVRYRRAAILSVIRVGWPGVLGAVMLTVAAISFLQSMTHTTVANTLFILGAIPFFTAGLAWIALRERPTRTTLGAMFVAFSGITIMIGEGFGSGSAYGNLMALVAAFCFSVYAVLIRHNRHIDMLPTLLISTILIMAVAGITKHDSLGISMDDLLLCMFWGGILSGFTSVCFIVASRYILAAEVTLLMLLEFALGPIWVWLFLDEAPSQWTVLGGALVISAIVVRSLLEMRQQEPNHPQQS